MWDTIVVGGGYAGLSAALILGRARRRVLLCHSGRQRNWASERVSAFLSRDGTPPAELRRVALAELRAYPSVRLREGRVVEARSRDGGFDVDLDDGERATCRKLLLATGVVDELPPVAGALELYGRGVYHCPYCDGFENADRPLAVWGRDRNAYELALELTGWSDDVTLCSDGPPEIGERERARLAHLGIRLLSRPIADLEACEGRLAAIRFVDGTRLACDALFFSTCGRQTCDLAEGLGCSLTARGSVETGRYERTEVPGLYVAGDASRNVQLAIIAAAEGAMAAFAINSELLKEDLSRRTARAEATTAG